MKLQYIMCDSSLLMSDAGPGDFFNILYFIVAVRIRSPKFVWALCAQLYSSADIPQHTPRIWTHIRRRYWAAQIDDISL
jgi:hypothetical protein